MSPLVFQVWAEAHRLMDYEWAVEREQGAGHSGSPQRHSRDIDKYILASLMSVTYYRHIPHGMDIYRPVESRP